MAFLFLSSYSYSQNQKVADSLIQVYERSKLSGVPKLELLHNIAANHTVFKEKIKYANLLISSATESGNDFWLHKGYMELGSGYKLQGDLELALDSYLKSIDAARRADFKEGIGGAYASIAAIYTVNGNRKNAKLYYNLAIATLSKTSDSLVYASVILNAGEEYFQSDDYDSALMFYLNSHRIFLKLNYSIGVAYALGNSGMVYAKQGKNDLAEKNLNDAISILEELRDYYPICVYLTYMSDIYREKDDDHAAMKYAQKSLELARQYGLKEQIGDANLKLSGLFEDSGDYRKSLGYFKEHVTYRDSVNNIKSVQQMADLRTEYEVAQKQIEVNLLNQQKKNQRIIVIASVVTSVLILLLAIGLYLRYNFIKKTKLIIEEEKNRSENLLLNILPEETARELKVSGKVQAKKFDSVTVLFTDFSGFTKLAEQVDPEHLIRSIDIYFREFDRISTKHGLEKIKTIGDSYMCAGGLPIENKTHAVNVILAAKEMNDFVNRMAIEDQDNLVRFEIRIGVHTGPVIAGIVGLKKWQYDIWGDTVNIASRMESMSEPGRINLSETTYGEIKNEFPCEYRGIIEVKNRGSLKMYFLS
jgi:adenylate cyclase